MQIKNGVSACILATHRYNSRASRQFLWPIKFKVDIGDNGVVYPAEVNDSIGMVATTDVAKFDRYPNGPVFAEVANLRAYLGEREAAVQLGPGGASIAFVSTDASGSNENGLARAQR